MQQQQQQLVLPQQGQGDELNVVTGPTPIIVSVRAGSAEMYGEPLLLGEKYLICPYTPFELLGGPADLILIGTPAYIDLQIRPHLVRNLQVINLVEKLNAHREHALRLHQAGPIVAVVGSEEVTKMLKNFSYRSNWLCPVLNLDRSGCHSLIEFLYQGPGVLQASMPDLVDPETLRILQNIENQPPNERLQTLTVAGSNSDMTGEDIPMPLDVQSRAFRDSEQTRVKLLSALSSMARREASFGSGEAEGDDQGKDNAEPQNNEGAVLNAWEATFRSLLGAEQGDIAVGCTCVDVAPGSCTCGAVKRLIDGAESYILQNLPPSIRAAGLLINVGDVGLASLAGIPVDAVVLAGLEPRTTQSVIDSTWPSSPPVLTFLNTPTNATSGAPKIERNVILAQRQTFLAGLHTAGQLPTYTHNQEVDFLRSCIQAFHPLFGVGFPICHVIDPLPLRLAFAPFSIPVYSQRSEEELGLLPCLLIGQSAAVPFKSIARTYNHVVYGYIQMPGEEASATLVSSCILLPGGSFVSRAIPATSAHPTIVLRVPVQLPL